MALCFGFFFFFVLIFFPGVVARYIFPTPQPPSHSRLLLFLSRWRSSPRLCWTFQRLWTRRLATVADEPIETSAPVAIAAADGIDQVGEGGAMDVGATTDASQWKPFRLPTTRQNP